MSEKTLSVIVPSYNMEKYLPKCLGSLVVAPELMEKLEVLVVNDGSKDRTSEIAHEFAAKWPQTFRVIDKKNGNYGSCINAALPVATGRYVRVLDADDSVLNGMFCEFLGWLTSATADLIISDYFKQDATGAIIASERFDLPGGVFSLNDARYDDFQLHAITYKRSCFADLEYRQCEGISYTDTEWRLEPICNVKTVQHFKKDLVAYLVGRDGQTMTPMAFSKNFWMLEKTVLKATKNVWNKIHRTSDGTRLWLENAVLKMIELIYYFQSHGYYGIPVEYKVGDFDSKLLCLAPDLYEKVGGKVLMSNKIKVSAVDEIRHHPLRCKLVFACFRLYYMLNARVRSLV